MRLTALNTFFSFCVASVLILSLNLRKYEKSIWNKIYIAAFTDEDKRIDEITGEIRLIKGIRNVMFFSKEMVADSFGSKLVGKTTLNKLDSVFPAALFKIYLNEMDFENFTETVQKISLIKGIKSVDDGGKAVRNLFKFFEKLKTLIFAAEIILIIVCLIAGFETILEGKEMRNRFMYLRERGFGKETIIMKNLTPIVFIPLISAIVSIFILFVIWKHAGDSLADFLNTTETLAVFLISFFPWFFIISGK